ncbi:efflux RND transporter permease subunit [candidate division KSB1 bacterium]|nr:efflux RND transporter permease subunit [candidate division KSB1 bacterium]
MKKIAQFAVSYPITVLMIVLAVLLLGYISFQKLGVDLFPDLNNPKIFIELVTGERPPAEIENQFVQNIESLAIRQKNVLQVSSIIQVGAAQVTVEYSWETDMDEAFLDLQKTLTSYSQNTEIDELTISQHDPNASPVMILGFSHQQIEDMDDLRQVAENYLRNELIRLEGIAEVELLGQEVKEVAIQTNEYLLKAHNLTAENIASRIQNYNRNVSGGSITEMGRRYVIKGVGEFQDLEDIGNIILTYNYFTYGDSVVRAPVYLKEVADINWQNKEPDNIVRIDQKRCMALAVYKETRFNTVKAVKTLMEALDRLRASLPGYQITIVRNQGTFISGAINEVKQTALIGILLAVLMLYVFLRRVGVTAIISVAIPISIVATFNLMYFNGLTLNVMTLGGLALGAGMLVDNAIIVVENIYRQMETGLPVKDAAVLGVSQVGGAITASTLTTIVVFLPIVFLHGAAGELFKDQAWTVTFSLLSSLVVAILVIPLLSAKFLRAKTLTKKSVQFSGYGRFLNRILNKSRYVISGAVLLVGLSLLLLPTIGGEFIPRTQSNNYTVNLRLAEGTDLYRTEQTVVNIENVLRETFGDQIFLLYSRIGPSLGLSSSETELFEDENTASVHITFTRKHKIPSAGILPAIQKTIGEISDAEVEVVQEQTELQQTFGTDLAPIVVEVKGEDNDVIQDLSEQVKSQMQLMPELFNVQTTLEGGRPEVEVVIDRLRAGILGVDISAISSQLQDRLLGREAGEWETGGELKDITIRLPEVSLKELQDMTIRTGNQEFRLYDVADIRVGQAPREIHRRNQVRIGKIMAHIKGDMAFTHVVEKIKNRLNKLDYPVGYSFAVTGEEQKRKEAFTNLKFALILSLLLVYMVLASQFESLIHPFTIILTIPLAVVGTILLFFLLGKSLSIMAYIGIVMLVGIAVNDSIILVDAINQLKRDGLSRRDAILEAGQKRIRPIIMTSLTTILALLPLTFGFGEGAALRAPMALAVIGGLTTSTILTLIVIPCVYMQLDKLTK